MLKKAIEEIYKDLLKNYDITNLDAAYTDKVYERNSGQVFSDAYGLSAYDIYWFRRGLPEELTDYTVAIMDKVQFKENVPCVFINKTTNKDNVFKLVNLLFTSQFQTDLKFKHGIGIMPVIDTPEVKEAFRFDSNWKCKREFESYTPKDAAQLYDMKDKTYEQVRTIDNSYFFKDSKQENDLIRYIYSKLKSLLDDPSLFDELDKRIEDFIINLNVHYN